MPHGKQAKMLTPKQETAVLTYLQTMRYPVRDRAMFLLSMKGLQAFLAENLLWVLQPLSLLTFRSRWSKRVSVIRSISSCKITAFFSRKSWSFTKAFVISMSNNALHHW
jgi:hypothetical protein